jgi:hypothetical protein
MATALVIEHFKVEQLAFGIAVTVDCSPTAFLTVEKKASITELSVRSASLRPTPGSTETIG